MGVFPTADSPGPPFTYTVGLVEKGMPEFIIIGLPADVAHTLIATAIKRFEKHGNKDPNGFPDMLVDTELANMPAIYRVLDPEKACADHATMARVWAGHAVPVTQIVWPDPAGKFPWEEGCDPAMAKAQSAIGGWV
jgi:hypothetical protein